MDMSQIPQIISPNKLRRAITVCLTIAAVVIICRTATARTVIDQTGEAVSVPDKPQRVIALTPSLTEMVFQLQRQELLKGASSHSDYPEEAKQIPQVGSYVQPNLERVVALKPDLCLAIKDSNSDRTIAAIRGLGIPIFVVDLQSIEQIMAATLDLGRVLQAEARARELVADAERRLARIAAKLATTEQRPKVFFQIDASPMLSVGKGTFQDHLITLAGGANVAAVASGYPHYNWEAILMFQPEVVIITTMAGLESPESLVAQWQAWPKLPAVHNRQIYVVDAELFNRPTLRLVAGIERLAPLIHPELFEAPDHQPRE